MENLSKKGESFNWNQYFSNRPDIVVAASFSDLEFPYQRGGQEVVYSEHIIAPGRPMTGFSEYERFVQTIGVRQDGVSIKKPNVRNNFLEFGAAMSTRLLNESVDPVSGQLFQRIDHAKVFVYPNRHLAWLIGEYEKDQKRQLIRSTWNAVELAKHGMPIELLNDKRALKAIVFELFEGEFFRLLK